MRITEVRKQLFKTIIFEHRLDESKNTHLEHLEDLIYNEGYEGAKQSINYLYSLYEMLKGKTDKGLNITTKWDGKPAVFVGTDPADGKFFVGTKSVFNKNPLLNKSTKDIDANHPDTEKQGERISKAGLREKLKYAYTYLKDLNIQGVLQGDLLFTDKDLTTEVIDGEEFIVFKPNALIYAVPKESDLAKEIQSAKIGIVFHTSYQGSSLEDMDAKFGFDASKLSKSPNVWFRDAIIKDVSGMVNLTDMESRDVLASIKRADTLLKSIDKKVFNFLETDLEFGQPLRAEIKTYINSFVRSEKPKFAQPNEFYQGFKDRIKNFFEKKIQGYKNQNTIDNWRQKYAKSIEFLLDENNQRDLLETYQLYLQLISTKEVLRQKLTRLRVMDTFARAEDGSFKVVGEEGFVAVDRDGNAIKLVDRLDFSNLNFNQ